MMKRESEPERRDTGRKINRKMCRRKGKTRKRERGREKWREVEKEDNVVANRVRGGKRVPEHWDGANWLVQCPLKSPSRYRLRSTEHIYVPTFQDDQLNGNGREISHQKQTFSHVSRSARLTHAATGATRHTHRPKTTPGGFWYEREGNRASDWAIVVACITIQRAVSIRIRPRGIHGRMTLSFAAIYLTIISRDKEN